MDHVYQDIEKHQDHQIINYLHRQFDRELTITEGMFETLHELLNVSRDEALTLSHEIRKKLNGTNSYFNKDGFHPGYEGAKYWCTKVLFPFLHKKGIL